MTVPTPQQLRKIAWLKLGNVGQASGRLKHLRKYGYFKHESRGVWSVRPELPHLQKTAQLLIQIVESVNGNSSLRLTRGEVLTIGRKLRVANPSRVIELASRAQHLRVVREGRDSFIVEGARFGQITPYLERLATLKG